MTWRQMIMAFILMFLVYALDRWGDKIQWVLEQQLSSEESNSD
jgi:hypothetical protein